MIVKYRHRSDFEVTIIEILTFCQVLLTLNVCYLFSSFKIVIYWWQLEFISKSVLTKYLACVHKINILFHVKETEIFFYA